MKNYIQRYKRIKKLFQGTSKAYLFQHNKMINPSPIMLFIETTKNCNYQCKYCDIWKEQSDRQELSTEQILNLIKEASELDVTIIDFFGGETLLRSDLDILIKTVNSYGIKSMVTTNGYLLEEKSDLLVDSQIGLVFVSLDHSIATKHNTLRGTEKAYERAIKGLQILKEKSQNRIKTGINFLISRDNYDDCMNAVKMAENLKVDAIRFLPIHNTYPFKHSTENKKKLFNSEELQILEEQIQQIIKHKKKSKLYFNSTKYLKEIINYFKHKNGQQFLCYAGLLSYDINAYGDIFTCITYNSPSGNITQSSLKDILSSDTNKEKLAKKCNDCCQPCYLEPSIRMSLPFSLSHLSYTLKELSLFT